MYCTLKYYTQFLINCSKFLKIIENKIFITHEECSKSIASFEFPRVLMFLMPTSTAILNIQLIFGSCFDCNCVLARLRFLPIPKNGSKNLNQIKCADAFRMLTVAYGEATLDRSNVYRWYKMFSADRTDVDDENVSDARARQQRTKTLIK